METIQLFPWCQASDCPQAEQAHKHIYPHQQEFLDAQSKYLGWLGGFRAGKTLPACVRGVLLSLTIPFNRGIIVRRTLPKLHDTTQRTFMEVLERAGIEGLQFRENREGYSHRIIFPNGSEVVFRPSEDIGRFLGPEYGWFLIDEAVEEPETTFTLLIGRLCLQLAGRYLCGMALSNPPPRGNWFYRHFGENPGIITRGRSGYQLFRSSTRLNPNLPEGYIEDLEVVYGKAGAQRVIEGFAGFTPDGQPVFSPPFQHEVHVGTPAWQAQLPLVRSWDFGFRHPAVTIHQMGRCRFKTVHWIILAEIAESFELEAEQLAQEVRTYTAQMFPLLHPWMLLDCGDKAGTNRTDKGPGPIARLKQPPHKLSIRWKPCNIDPGIELIARRLRSTCPCGSPVVVVHRRCAHVIDALSGGYHWPRSRTGSGPGMKPHKDGFYDDVMDSVRYAGENFLRGALRDESYLAGRVKRQLPVEIRAVEPWRWMVDGSSGLTRLTEWG